MTVWMILPRDALIFRDGRPFGPSPGARALSLPFPYPSTIAGAVRTRAGWRPQTGFDKGRIPELLTKRVRGPFLVEVEPTADQVKTWLFPAPGDCQLQKGENNADTIRTVWIRPVETPPGVRVGLPDGLLLVSAQPAINEKGPPDAPRFWRWEALQAWLVNPKDMHTISPSSLGIPALPMDDRMHVSINTQTDTAVEGRLFQTRALSFVQVLEKENKQSKDDRDRGTTHFYALVLETDAELTPGPDFLGGERRIVAWQTLENDLPALPGEIEDRLAATGHCRLVLATPGIFEKGYLPTWLYNATPGVKVTTIAAATARPQAVSGWDYKKKQAKPSRWMTPAGAVYFLRVEGDESARRAFARRIWLQAISDEEQDRRDGFGIALLGTWDGKTETLEVKHE